MCQWAAFMGTLWPDLYFNVLGTITCKSLIPYLGMSLGRVPLQGVRFVALSEGKTKVTQLVTCCNLTTRRHYILWTGPLFRHLWYWRPSKTLKQTTTPVLSVVTARATFTQATLDIFWTVTRSSAAMQSSHFFSFIMWLVRNIKKRHNLQFKTRRRAGDGRSSPLNWVTWPNTSVLLPWLPPQCLSLSFSSADSLFIFIPMSSTMWFLPPSFPSSTFATALDSPTAFFPFCHLPLTLRHAALSRFFQFLFTKAKLVYWSTKFRSKKKKKRLSYQFWHYLFYYLLS